jgi:hypothetical protein
MYHPAAALHQPSLRETVQADFAKLPALIEGKAPVQEFKENPPSDPEQLSLF